MKSAQEIALELRDYLVGLDRHDEAPKEAWAAYETAHFEDVPASMAFHPEYGWCVVAATKDGPRLAYVQHVPGEE